MQKKQSGSSVACVTVTFNPDPNVLQKQLAQVSPQVGRVFLIDNGSSNAEEISGIAESIARVRVILCQANLGLGRAQNLGIRACRDEGMTMVLLLDQDSIPRSNMIETLLIALNQLTQVREKVAAVGACYTGSNTGHPSFFVQFKRFRFQKCFCNHAETDQLIPADMLISAGSLIPIHALDTIGEMDEDLFIDHWMQRLRIDPSHELFVQLSIEYFDYLKSRFDDAPDPGALLDILPMNIMVAPSGEWHSFDHEWATTTPIDTAFVFFRGLFYFCQAAQKILRVVYHNQQDWTLQTALSSCFLAVGLDLKSNLDKLIDCEEAIQTTALKGRKGVSTQDFLRLRLSAPRQTVQIFWARAPEEFTEPKSQTNYISIGEEFQSLSFTLPKGIRPPIGLRVDPGTEKGVFNIQSIRVRWLGNNSSTSLQTIYPHNSRDRKLLTFHNIRHYSADRKQPLFALTQDPFISWQVPTNSSCQSDGSMRVELALNWLGSTPDDHDLSSTSKHADDTEYSESLFSFRRVRALFSLIGRWHSYQKQSRKI